MRQDDIFSIEIQAIMIIVGLGSNKAFDGQTPRDIITHVLQERLEAAGSVLAASRLYRSTAWPNPSHPPYVNAVATMKSPLPPQAFLEKLHAIEASFGRERAYETTEEARYAPRTLDLDLLDYDGQVIGAELSGKALRSLILPHPGIAARDFVLCPLLDICPDWLHPETGCSGRALLQKLWDTGISDKATPLN